MAKKYASQIVESGDVFFFYRPKVDVIEVKDVDVVPRFYMVTAPEAKNKLRLFLIGKKQKVEAAREIQTIRALPDRTYHNMPEVEKPVGQVL